LPSVFGARRRLTTSATATTYGHSARSSHDPRRDGHLDALPFLTCHALSLAEAVTGGEPRNAHRLRPRCRFLLALTRFSRPRYLLRCATSADCSDGVLVAINVHGSEDQEKDASSAERERHVSVFLASGACASKSACGRRSLPGRPLDIRCRRCVTERGGDPFPMPDRTKIRVPTLTREGQRHPANRDAFHRCNRVRRSSVGLLHRMNPARRSLAHAAHTFSTRCGEVPSRALQAPECGHPRSLAIRGTGHLCYRWVRFFRICRAWD
jgi:hypothetical protein